MKKKKVSKALIDFEDIQQKEIMAITTKIISEEVTRLEEGKTISISKLPDCRHKTRLINIVQDADMAKIVVTAYLEKDGRWNVYAGWPDVRDLKVIIEDQIFDTLWRCENIRTAEQVLMLGEKLEKETALILFPDWSMRECGE